MANNIGAGEGAKSTMVSRSQVRKSGKVGLNQSLIYIQPFPPLSPDFFICPS